MDFVVDLPKTVKGFNAIWVIVDRLTKATHFLPVKTIFSMTQYAELSPIHGDKVGERAAIGPEIVQHTADLVIKIRDIMKTAQSRQKSYADKRRRDLEFAVGDHVFVKVAPMKNAMRFGKKVKFIPRFIGPFGILDKVGALAYRVALPPNLAGVHNVFHASMLRKNMSKYFTCTEF
ncbi:uncharacterized protein [Primulina huaijiensis]|uniref:uncharacterized protein n=1 Tax=Primulina huaijiensis TaxID=1492673 RepID=UPI003CC73AA0